MRRLILALFALSACTPAEEGAWHHWHQLDPTAAVEYLYDHGIATQPDQPDHPDEADDEYRPSSLGGRCSQWADTALAVGWSSSDWPTLDRIMYAESRCSPSAYNSQPHFGGHASGLMQVVWPTWAGECGDGDIFDPAFNLQCALYLKTSYGWGQWVTY